ncbi:helix-turn-helix domain-containing protein [Filimonas effusa]|uniref:Helix-turn-helix domain-containing protein n=1 Tax=Filimonas effusa TaxID=2508721 RepID=A0A4Q1DAP4_9BACT|nr:helix-turn-helix domain-containing protein [Filimonas effusa]RXK85978.1 helix-turn-helix domain-containing protein [Filimonas effusa]
MNRLIITISLLVTALIAKANDFVFTPVDVSHGLSDNQVRYILQLHDGRMVFTTSGNLNLFNGAQFKYIHRKEEHVYPLKNYNGHYRVYQQGDSLLWIKDAHKLMCVNLYQENYRSGLDVHLKKLGLPQPAEDLFVDAEQRLWLLSAGKLWCNSAMQQPLDLSGNEGALQDLMADKNSLYLFYNTGEIIVYNLETGKPRCRKAAYPKEQQPFFKNTSLVVKGKNGFYQLRNGSKGGLFFFNLQQCTWEKILETNYTLNTLVVKDETAYVSCTNGFWILDRSKGTQEYLPTLKTVDGKIIDTEISTLFYDKQGGFWLGTLNQGLLYYHPGRYKLSYIGRPYFPASSTKDLIVQAFAEDRKGNIFIKCSSGIYNYHPASGSRSLTRVATSVVSKEILDKLYQDPGQNNPYTDSRGWKWIATKDGLKLGRPGEAPITYYTEQGLANNFVHAILEDRKHRLWITTSYGLSKIEIDPADNKAHFTNFNTYDGALEGEYSGGAAFESANGTLYFGGINGFNILNPDQIAALRQSFQPVFTNLFLKGDKVEPGRSYDNNIILSRATPYTQQINLAYNQNFLTFEFSGVNYLNPSQTRYRYRLQGIDAGWREATGSQQADASGILRISYTNLPPGKYVLKVSTGNQQETGTTLTITIRPPWWKTTSAYTLYIIAVITILAGGIWCYTRFTRKRMERLHKEDILLLRIRSLIEQCRLLEEERETRSVQTDADEKHAEETTPLSPADAAFLAKAIEQVEKNLEEPGYSVEMLSRDLCMDRTGLYRKLIALLDKSPSLFIRNIRLQNAARLILEEELPIAAIAGKVGFNSASYLSKCFQEVYGCRPSEYAAKAKKKST